MKTITLDDATLLCTEGCHERRGHAGCAHRTDTASRPNCTGTAAEFGWCDVSDRAAHRRRQEVPAYRDLDYRNALRTKPGSHQLLEDMLTDSRGRTSPTIRRTTRCRRSSTC